MFHLKHKRREETLRMMPGRLPWKVLLTGGFGPLATQKARWSARRAKEPTPVGQGKLESVAM
jgi:hypothetical protein